MTKKSVIEKGHINQRVSMAVSHLKILAQPDHDLSFVVDIDFDIESINGACTMVHRSSSVRDMSFRFGCGGELIIGPFLMNTSGGFAPLLNEYFSEDVEFDFVPEAATVTLSSYMKFELMPNGSVSSTTISTSKILGMASG